MEEQLWTALEVHGPTALFYRAQQTFLMAEVCIETMMKLLSRFREIDKLARARVSRKDFTFQDFNSNSIYTIQL